MSSDRFHKAARDGLIDVLKEGTAKELNTRDATGMTPVHCAALVGRLDALRLLVGRGGNPDKTDYYGNTALHIAAAKGHMQCVDFLVKFGVNLYAKDIERHNAKHLACLNNREDILIYLDTAIANLEMTDRRKAKALQETAEKECLKVIAKYNKYKQRMNQENDDDVHTMPHRTSTVLRAMRKLPLGGSKRDAAATEASPQNNNKTNFSSHVRGTFSRSRGVQRHIPQWMRHGPKDAVVDDFRVRKMDPSGKLTVSSLQGTRRDSEVLYVGTHASANGTKGERGRIRDVFEVGTISNEEDDAESLQNSYGNLSRSVSQPDFLAAVSNGDDLSEEIAMQRPSGLFNRPSLGTLAFRRSVNATLSQMALDASSIESNESRKKKSQKIKPRNQFNLSDSDTDVASSSDTDQEDGQTPLERFLLAFGLEEYYPIFEKERITLDILMILKEQDIEKLQLPLGPFRKLMNAVEERRNALSNPGAITDSRL